QIGGVLPRVDTKISSADTAIVPPARTRYLADIATAVREHHAKVADQAAVARELQQVQAVRSLVEAAGGDIAAAKLPELEAAADHRLDAEARDLLADWPQTVADYSGDEHVVEIRGKELHTELTKESL